MNGFLFDKAERLGLPCFRKFSQINDFNKGYIYSNLGYNHSNKKFNDKKLEEPKSSS